MNRTRIQPSLYVHRLSPVTDPLCMRGQLVVVIDLLRATTTMNYALAAGVKQIVPVVEIEEARQLAEKYTRSGVILCGERRCVPIPGFDCGNSPSDYTTEKASGKTMLFSTTNGTRAVYRAGEARRILCGALVNLHAVVKAIHRDVTSQLEYPSVGDVPEVHLLCAGSADQFSLDDWWCAGAITEALQQANGEMYEESSETTAARLAWQKIWQNVNRSSSGEVTDSDTDVTDSNTADTFDATDANTTIAHSAAHAMTDSELSTVTSFISRPDAVVAERLVAQLQTTLAGQKLTAAGLQKDLFDVVAINRFDSVPEVERSGTPWIIR